MSGRLVLILSIIVLVLGIMAVRWYQKIPPQQAAAKLRNALLIGGGLFLILLAATGRLHWLFALAGGAMAFAQRMLGVWRVVNLFKGFQSQQKRPSGGQQSQIETLFLRMTLDHDSGEMSGTVLSGQYQGRQLHELSLTDQLELLRECRIQDPQSAAVLEAYLDRMVGAQWREHLAEGDAQYTDVQSNSSTMTPKEALQILGLEDGAIPDEITDAHRRLIQKMHPDRGGSSFLAAKINTAKDVLMRE